MINIEVQNKWILPGLKRYTTTFMMRKLALYRACLTGFRMYSLCVLKIPANLKYNFRLAGIFLLILYILTTIIKSEFRLAGGLLCHIYKER